MAQQLLICLKEGGNLREMLSRLVLVRNIIFYALFRKPPPV